MKIKTARIYFECGCVDLLYGDGFGQRELTCSDHEARLAQAEAELDRGEGRDFREVLEELTEREEQ